MPVIGDPLYAPPAAASFRPNMWDAPGIIGGYSHPSQRRSFLRARRPIGLPGATARPQKATFSPGHHHPRSPLQGLAALELPARRLPPAALALLAPPAPPPRAQLRQALLQLLAARSAAPVAPRTRYQMPQRRAMPLY